MKSRGNLSRTALILAILGSLILVSGPAHAGCLTAVRTFFGHLTGNDAPADTPANVFALVKPNSVLKYVEREGKKRKVTVESYDPVEGRLTFIDEDGKSVTTTVPSFLATMKDCVLVVDGRYRPIKLTGLAKKSVLYDTINARLGTLGLKVLDSSRADSILSLYPVNSETGLRPTCVFDAESRRFLLGSNATLADLLGELHRVETWTPAGNGVDSAFIRLALAVTRTDGGLGPVPPRLSQILELARALRPENISDTETGVLDRTEALRMAKDIDATIADLDIEIANLTNSDPRRAALIEAAAKLKANALETKTRVLAKHPAPVAPVVAPALALSSGTKLALAKTVIATADVPKVVELAKKFGVEGFASNTYADLIATVRGKITSGTDPPLKAGDTMAQFGLELDKLLAGVSDEGQRVIRFSVAEAVEQLEAFKPSDYIEKSISDLEEHRRNYIAVSQYPDYVESYIKRQPPYTDLTYPSAILGITDIRDSSSHNMWPLLLNGHDIRHVHYALGHPRAMAAYFMSARSQSRLRFTMVSAMYEGVDTTQYDHEILLAKYMIDTMHMDLEQAMVYLAKAPEAELERVAKATGAWTDIDRYADKQDGWRPKKTSEFPAGGKDSGNLDTDLDNQVQSFETYGKDSTHDKFTNYTREPGPGGSTTQDNSIHFNTRTIY